MRKEHSYGKLDSMNKSTAPVSQSDPQKDYSMTTSFGTRVRWMAVGLAIVYPGRSALAQGGTDSTSIALAEARAALTVRDQIDEYLELRRSVFQPATRLNSTHHLRDAEWALETLDMFEEGKDAALAGLKLSLDDRIDLVLLAHHSADLRARLRASIDDEESLRALFPAAALRERLPKSEKSNTRSAT